MSERQINDNLKPTVKISSAEIMENQNDNDRNLMIGINKNPNQDNAVPGIWKKKHKKLPRTYINILHDPRVVKGNTYAAFVIPSSLQLEFLRLKEEEERRIRVMKQDNKLPRVALLGLNKNKKDYDHEIEDKRPDSPTYNLVEEEQNEDDPYFFIDKAPTPKYIPLPPGREQGTQIEDLELFDFDLEVESILQVLVGRTLVMSRYELLEEEERRGFLEQRRQISQNREFELIKLQREEAARMRREKEIERRNLQKKERVERMKLIQKKIQAKLNSKSYLSNLKSNVFNHLIEKGLFTKKTEMKLLEVVGNKILPIAHNLSLRTDINKIIFETMKKNIIKKETSKHSILMKQVFEDRDVEAQKKKVEAEEKRLSDIQFEKETIERKEKRRVAKFTRIVEETILKTKYDKVDLTNVPIVDIDELTLSSGSIHSVGGQFGEFVIAIQALLDSLIYKYASIAQSTNNLNKEENIISTENNLTEGNKEQNKDNNNNISQMINTNSKFRKTKELNLESFIQTLVRNFLLGLKDTETFTLKYLKSNRFDFTAIPEEADKRKEYKDYMLDMKRFYNKSLKILLNQNQVETKLFDIVLKELADIYFKLPTDINNPDIQVEINPTPDNQEPEYLAKVKEATEKINQDNILLEKMKKKIKISFIEPEALKKKRNNIISLIRIFPTLDTYDTFTEQYVEEQIEVDEEAMEDINNDEVNIENKDNIINDENNADNYKKENEDNEIKDNNAEKKDDNNSVNKQTGENKVDEVNVNTQENKEINAQENKDINKATLEVKEPRNITFQYINKAQLLRNVNIVGDCYVSHREVSDLYKLTILRNITQDFRKYYKKYKEEKDEEDRIIREIEEEKQAKIRAEEEKKRIEEEEIKRIEEEEKEKERLEKEKENAEELKLEKKDTIVEKKLSSKLSTLNSKKTKEFKNTSSENNASNLNNSNNSNQKTSNKNVNLNSSQTKFINDNQILEKVEEEEAVKDDFCSKNLLDLIKPRYNKCQEYVENYILGNEEFWSKNRKKFYKIIPIDVIPPKIEENKEEEQDNN